MNHEHWGKPLPAPGTPSEQSSGNGNIFKKRGVTEFPLPMLQFTGFHRSCHFGSFQISKMERNPGKSNSRPHLPVPVYFVFCSPLFLNYFVLLFARPRVDLVSKAPPGAGPRRGAPRTPGTSLCANFALGNPCRLAKGGIPVYKGESGCFFLFGLFGFLFGFPTYQSAKGVAIWLEQWQ